jgi:hypothetical protein
MWTARAAAPAVLAQFTLDFGSNFVNRFADTLPAGC